MKSQGGVREKSEIFGLVKLWQTCSTTLNDIINEIKNKILSITNLATAAALTAAENKIPNVSDLVKKVDYDAKISEIENKYFTTSDYKSS